MDDMERIDHCQHCGLGRVPTDVVLDDLTAALGKGDTASSAIILSHLLQTVMALIETQMEADDLIFAKVELD